MTNLIPQMTWFRPVSPYQNGGLYSGFNREIDRFFDELSGMTSPKSNVSQPRISVWETNGAIEIEAELPGVDEKDIDVELTDDVLTIKGEKRVERDEAHKDAYYQERTFGKFARSITLPFEPDPKAVKTLFTRGVLKLTLPKSADVKEHTVRIPVKAAA
jgi:HSP20 family protein